MSSEFLKVVRDIHASLRMWRLWVHLGWNDVAKQYRRSFLGPIWITLNTGIFVVAFSFIGAQLFNTGLDYYLAYFGPGNIIFMYFATQVSEGCATFTNSESYLKQAAVPKMIFVFRVIVRNLIMLGHNSFIIIGALLWLGAVGSIRWGELLLGFSLVLIAAFFAIAILGAIAARYRDIPMMVTSAVQVLYFLTPVFWRPEQISERAKWLVVLNPFAIFLDMIRKPLLGEPVAQQTLVSALFIISLLAAVFFPLYMIARRRIVYWL